jgi:uncharacterized membrane protein YfcA
MPAVFLIIGLIGGLVSGTFGVGGGIVLVPLLMFAAKMPPQMATGTSLSVLVLPVVSLGAWNYYRNGNVNVPAALWVAAGLFVGAYFGSKLAQEMSPLVLRRSFAVLILFAAGKLWVG